MTDAVYEYYGMMAETWDLFRGDTSNWEDRRFYLDIIQEFGQPVLDVGCGTGRLLLDYLSQGIDIDGIDNSPEMLNLCQQKAIDLGLNPSLFEQKMETMKLPRRYKTIIVPSSSFQLILDPQLARQAIACFFDHLLSSGVLVMPFMKVWKEGYDSSWRKTGEKERPSDGAMIVRWSRNWYDPQTQLEHTENRYEVIKDGITIAREHHLKSPATREYTQKQALDLFIHAGFVDLRIYKGFTHEQASDDEDVFTISGVKL